MIRITFSVILLATCFLVKGQYTDQINSNRPGRSIGAFAVGKNVVQAEAGFAIKRYSHSGYNNSTFNGGIGFLSLRWGFLKETLELTYQGQFLSGKLTSKIPSEQIIIPKSGFLQNFIGLKYLLYDPFKKGRKVNPYSWKSNNSFKLRDLLPAASLIIGTNISFKKNKPFPFSNVFGNIYRPIFFQNLNVTQDEEPFAHLRATLATQSHFLDTWVFVTNFTYDRYLSKYPEKSYIFTLTHAIDNLWSVYIEHHGIKSDLYIDGLFRLGAAYLFGNNIQFEGTIGSSVKDTPNQLLLNLGISYRLDFHKDFESSAELEFKKLKKEEKQLKKTLKKNSKKGRKRNRKAKS